mgnify:CR=1 FL=1
MIESGRIFSGRYELDVQVSSPLGISVWKANDRLLKRPVQVHLIPTTDPRAREVLNRSLSVSKRNERDSISILDVIEAGQINADETKFVGIITEWVDGQSLDQRLSSDRSLTSSEALVLISHIVIALNSAHQQNISHGRLRPHNIIFADSDEVRIRGFGIDGPILGIDGVDGIQADIKGVGRLLFAAVTGMWPHETADGLPAAQTSEQLAVPSNFASGITHSVDSIYRRTQDGTFVTMRDVMHALSIGTVENERESVSPLNRLTDHVVTWHGHPESQADRKRATIYALIGVLVFAWVGSKLMSINFDSNEVPETFTSPTLSSTPNVSASQSASGELVTIRSVSAFDPYGDNSENDAKVKNVVDGDTKTTWTTVDYKKADLGGKPGVGLLLDLGAPRPVSTVGIQFTSPGASVTVYVTDEAQPDITKATKLSSGVASSNLLAVKSPRPVSGRYVIVWLTKIPQSGSVWKSGISEITVGL